MGKFAACILLGVLIGMLLFPLGFISHNYELNKCNSLDTNTNQEYYNYELQENCYMVLERPGWNLFWECIAIAIIGMMIFGFIGFIIGMVFFDDY